MIVIKEVKILWKKRNLPIQQSKSTVERKIENVLKNYEEDSNVFPFSSVTLNKFVFHELVQCN